MINYDKADRCASYFQGHCSRNGYPPFDCETCKSFRDKKEAQAGAETGSSRIEKIQAYAKNRTMEASRKLAFEAKAVACLTEQVRALQPRIEELIITANACLENGICIDRCGDSLTSCYDTYEEGTFFTNGVTHRLGFVYAPLCSRRRVDVVGIDAGGVCGDWNFRTDGNAVYSQYQQQTSTRKEPQRKHLEQFLNSFDCFETAFYAYVDKIVGYNESGENTIHEPFKKLVFRNEHGSVELDDYVYEAEYHAYWGGICKECFAKHEKILENNIDDGGGSGICSVKGCNNEAHFYADFMEESVRICDDTDFVQPENPLNTEQFKEYLASNFTLSGETTRFIGNIVEYAVEMFDDTKDAKQFLKTMFAGTIGITDAELDMLMLEQEDTRDEA